MTIVIHANWFAVVIGFWSLALGICIGVKWELRCSAETRKMWHNTWVMWVETTKEFNEWSRAVIKLLGSETTT